MRNTIRPSGIKATSHVRSFSSNVGGIRGLRDGLISICDRVMREFQTYIQKIGCCVTYIPQIVQCWTVDYNTLILGIGYYNTTIIVTTYT